MTSFWSTPAGGDGVITSIEDVVTAGGGGVDVVGGVEEDVAGREGVGIAHTPCSFSSDPGGHRHSNLPG